MNKWILGARPRTLPAAIGPVVVGTALIRTTHHSINWLNAAMALVVSLFLQIGVNFSNDYSDGVRGTDGDRVGPTRLVASGLASPRSVKNAAIITYGLAALIGLELSYRTSLWLILVGAIAIISAWGYTGGKNPYGYRGFGELSVFIFFGLAATIGSYFVQSEKVTWSSIALAIPMGCLSCAILSVNNLRDRPKDSYLVKSSLEFPALALVRSWERLRDFKCSSRCAWLWHFLFSELNSDYEIRTPRNHRSRSMGFCVLRLCNH